VISENGNSHFSTPTPPIKKIEIILLLFGIAGFLIDLLFTILWIYFEF